MLKENKKKDVQEITTILTKLDNTDRTIMLSNAMVLLARQEVSKNKDECKTVREAEKKILLNEVQLN